MGCPRRRGKEGAGCSGLCSAAAAGARDHWEEEPGDREPAGHSAYPSLWGGIDPRSGGPRRPHTVHLPAPRHTSGCEPASQPGTTSRRSGRKPRGVTPLTAGLGSCPRGLGGGRQGERAH
jgi:hypothetical protein